MKAKLPTRPAKPVSLVKLTRSRGARVRRILSGMSTASRP
jgi:hypothetical protein